MIVKAAHYGLMLLLAEGDDDSRLPEESINRRVPDELSNPPIPNLPDPNEDTLMIYPMHSLGPMFLELPSTQYSFLEPSKARKDHEPNVAKRTSFPDTLRSFRSPRKGGKR